MSNEPTSGASSRDRRHARRIERRESVSIQIFLPCAERPGCPRVVTSETADVSGEGLRLLLPEPLEAERILDLCVALMGNPRRFLLTAETRWCRQDPGTGHYEVGLRVHEGEGTDFAEWLAAFPD